MTIYNNIILNKKYCTNAQYLFYLYGIIELRIALSLEQYNRAILRTALRIKRKNEIVSQLGHLSHFGVASIFSQKSHIEVMLKSCYFWRGF